jgi:tetratricopeptide (TPR) repeat protein
MSNQPTNSHARRAASVRTERWLSFCLAATLGLFACAVATARQKSTAAQTATGDERATQQSAPRSASRQGESTRRTRRGSARHAASRKRNDASAVRVRRVNAPASKEAAADDAANKADAKADATLVKTADEDTAGAGEAKKDSAASDAASTEESGAADPEKELGRLREKIEEAKAGPERARMQHALASRLVELERKTEAVAFLREMTSEERFDPPYFYKVGNALARLGESDAAADAYRKAIQQRKGNYARAQHNLGVVLIRQGRWEEAQEALRMALKLENYSYAEASYNLGRLYALRGEAGLAIDEWTRTLALKPDHDEAAAALARALAEDGDPDRALSILDAFTSRFTRRGATPPREIAVTRGEIVAALNLAAEQRAAQKSEQQGEPKAAPKSATTDASRATASSAAASNAPALDIFNIGVETEARGSARALRPLTTDARTYDLLRRARAAREAGQNEEAARIYRQAIQSGRGYFPPANLELGYALGALGRNEEAIQTLLKVVSKEGARYPMAYYFLGRFYEQTGELERSAEAFGRAVTLFGDANPQPLIDVSRVREKEGKLGEALGAMESYQRAIERTGSSAPEWVRERINKLREKRASSSGAQVK